MEPLSILTVGFISFVVAYATFVICKVLGLTSLYVSEKDVDPPSKLIEFVIFGILGVIVAPLAEELIFRKLLFWVSFSLGMSVVPTIIITSVMFSMSHTSNRRSLPLPQLFGGVILGLVYLSGGFWPAVFVHATHNAMALGIAFLIRSRELRAIEISTTEGE